MAIIYQYRARKALSQKHRVIKIKALFLIFIGFYYSVLTCKPKFGVFALYNHSVCNITNIANSYKNRFVLIQR